MQNNVLNEIEEIEDRAIGCFMGLAIGDAMGAPVEFETFGTFEPVTGYREGGPFSLEAGQWTDDTSQALCLAESLLKDRNFDAKDFMNRMCNWYLHGYNSSTGTCFDVGTGTVKAIHSFLREGVIPSNSHSAGNGCIMRLAPAVISGFPDYSKVLANSLESCKVTHGHPLARDATQLLALVIAHLIGNGNSEPYISFRFLGEDPIALPFARDMNPNLASSLQQLSKDVLRKHEFPYRSTTGHVVDTLMAALYSLLTTTNFRDCVLKAVNLGGDADSVGAVAGQLAGAKYGFKSIPGQWVNELQDWERFFDLSRTLFNDIPDTK